MNKKYELILFDLDGTLFDYNKAEKYALKSSLSYFNIDCNPILCLEKYRKVNKKMWTALEKGEITLAELRVERFKVLFNLVGLKQNVKAFSKRYLDFISKASFMVKGAEETISALSTKYKLALVTNGIYSVQYNRLKISPLYEYFDVLVASEKIGIAKPDSDFFSFVFEITEHDDKRTAMIVGDSLSSDIKGGCNFGIDTCWFNPDRIENREGIEPTYEVEELSQIKDILLC